MVNSLKLLRYIYIYIIFFSLFFLSRFSHARERGYDACMRFLFIYFHRIRDRTRTIIWSDLNSFIPTDERPLSCTLYNTACCTRNRVIFTSSALKTQEKKTCMNTTPSIDDQYSYELQARMKNAWKRYGVEWESNGTAQEELVNGTSHVFITRACSYEISVWKIKNF